MNSLFRWMTWLLRIAAVIAMVVLAARGPAHAQTATCTPQATLPADIPESGPVDTGVNVIATFNNARQREGCNVPLNIDPAAYDAATPQMQELMLINAERQDRGLGLLQLDTTLLSQIDLNHSAEMVQYNYFSHPSPINQNLPTGSATARDEENPAIIGHFDLCCAENIVGGGTPADGIYRFMYEDSDSTWGHRQNILGYFQGTPGHYTWIGIGIATGGTFGLYSTLDFLEDVTGTKYTPPPTADTQPPAMTPPTIVNANTVQVTKVQDNSNGAQAAGVSGVVFYVGSAVDAKGNFLTVVGKQAAPGTWTATLAATDPATLHAVAVDGSGNFTDCLATASSCGPPFLYASTTVGKILQYSLPITTNSTPNLKIATNNVTLAMAVNSSGNLAVAGNPGGISIFSAPVTSASTASATFANGTNFVGQLLFNSQGTLFAPTEAAAVDLFAPPLTSASTVEQTIAGLVANGGGAGLDAKNNLYVSNSVQGGNALFVFAPPYTGGATLAALSPAGAYGNIAISGTQLFAVNVPNTVDVFDLPLGMTSPPAVAFTVTGASSLALDNAGNLYVGSSGGTIEVFQPPFSATSTPTVTLAPSQGAVEAIAIH